jgi:hypothetical protein
MHKILAVFLLQKSIGWLAVFGGAVVFSASNAFW